MLLVCDHDQKSGQQNLSVLEPYQKPEPLKDHPDVPFEWMQEDSNLPPFLILECDGLVEFLDAAHATDLRRPFPT